MNKLKESPCQCPLTSSHANSARLASFSRTLTRLLTAPVIQWIPTTVFLSKCYLSAPGVSSRHDWGHIP